MQKFVQKVKETVAPKQVVSRPVVFRQLYEKHYKTLRRQLFSGAWTGGATRKRVRLLARKMAREEMGRALAVARQAA